MEAEQITEQFRRSLKINDADSDEKYNRLTQKGKEAAQQGDLELSLSLFRHAFDLRPSEKLRSRIERLEEAIKDLNVSEEEEEFVDVLGSGLMMYKGLYDQLYEHQKEGVAFLFSLNRDRRVGGILADDMGLGKTVQVICFLSAMYDTELTNHTLLVMPTSLIKNWLSEFKRWTPGLRVKDFHGTSRSERSRNLERIQRGSGVIITTYQMLINNWQQLASYGGREFCWDYIILDEAHKIKSTSTKTAKSVYQVPAKHRILLTGTPVQNNLREMWALFDFACQGALLGSAKTFKSEYENPITRAREKDATPGEKALGLKISQNLSELIRPYFLRRTKAEVQNRKQTTRRANEEDQEQLVQNQPSMRVHEIPSLTRKTDLIVWIYLSDVQEDIYRKFISLDHIKELLTTTRNPLADLTMLKKLCDHPRLLSARAITQLGLGTGPDHFLEDDGQSNASSIVDVADEMLIAESGKLRFLISLLESLRDEGKRTLVFSQSRKVLDIIERVLTNRKFHLLRVDGTITHLAERHRRIALFQTDTRYSVFLLTSQVGGVGLTLTAANRVVIFDPSWNPATDAQAVDRAYRIGQTHDVIIYRLITCGTVEEMIYRRQVFKDSLIRQTTGDKKNPFRYFTKQELKELFMLEDTRSSSTQLQLQSLHSSACRSDPELQRYISTLKAMNVFGVSHHDLLFSNEEDEDMLQDEETHYIDQRVQKAQELVQAESHLHSLMLDSVNQNTEPAWLRLSRQQVMDQHVAAGDGKAKPPGRILSPPVIDITQSGSDEQEMDLSTLGTGDSLIMESDHTHTVSDPIIHTSPFSLSVAPMGAESQLSEACSEVDTGSPNALLEVGLESSAPPVVVDSDLEEQTGAESFQWNFNLQLEDSAELLSEDKEEEPEEVEPHTGAEDFQLLMDDSRERIDESNHEDMKQTSVVSTPSNESLLWPTKKKKLRVIYDSEDEEQSILAGSFMDVGCSTPKSVVNSGNKHRSSVNISVSSRRSLVKSLLQDMEEESVEGEELEEGISEGAGCSQASKTNDMYVVESLLEETEPTVKTLNSDLLECEEEEEECEEEEEECEEEEEECEEEEHGEELEEGISEGAGCSQAHKTNEIYAVESLLEEKEPSVETTNSDLLECEEELEEEHEEEWEEVEKDEEEEEWEEVEECEEVQEHEQGREEEEEGEECCGGKGFSDESTDVELASSEVLEPCAPPELSLNDITPPEETFESLVHSGKQCLSDGRKQEALDFFLKAIDINTGDTEIQLLIIQLYRHLCH